MLKKAILSAAILTAGLGTAPLFAVQLKGENVKETLQNAQSEAVKQLRVKKLAKVVKEAASVLQETQTAYLLLQQGKSKKALTILQKVQEQLKLLVDKHGLVNLPADVSFVEFNGISDLQTARNFNKKAKELVTHNNFVDARFVLALLRNEIDITTTYIPLKLYKEAIDLAVNLLQLGNKDAALSALQSALGTLIVETMIVPKPVLEAQFLIEKAGAIYQVNPTAALAYLKKAEYDIKLTKALGYISSQKDIEPLVEKIEKLMKAVREHAATTEEQFKEVKKEFEKTKEESITKTH